MTSNRLRSLAVTAICGLIAITVSLHPANAAQPEQTIVLPGARSAEGIAGDGGKTFFAGELFTGDIFRGNIRTGEVAKFIDAPAGLMATGLRVDPHHGLLFVAGAFDGTARVYNSSTGALVRSYQLADPTQAPTMINDVAVTNDGAWFTDSYRAQLYFIPVTRQGPGEATTLGLTGPAADLSGAFNNNGIQAADGGRTLIVAHSGNGLLNTVDPVTGASTTVEGVSVPNVDGILLQGRTLWAVQNFSNQISEVRLNGDLSSGAIEDTITSGSFEVPTTVALLGNRLAVVNAKFDTGLPPTAAEYEVVVVNR